MQCIWLLGKHIFSDNISPCMDSGIQNVHMHACFVREVWFVGCPCTCVIAWGLSVTAFPDITDGDGLK